MQPSQTRLSINEEQGTANSVAGLIDENSERIGFVLSCLFAEAINMAELRQWAGRILQTTNAFPSYLTSLIDFKEPLFRIYNVIGFAPHWAHTDDDTLAISGIAFKRNRQPFDHPILRQEALRKLEETPQIEQRFRLEFPFLES